MSFEKWLLKQKDRDDPIGDLAKDFKHSRKMHPTIKTIEESFHYYSPCQAALEAYECAKEEFKESLSNAG